jgi:MtN3 and saliva related transmembrane protein
MTPVDLSNVVGTAAAVCTTVAYLPQAIKTWRSGSTEDISLLMFLCMCVGTILWLTYGIIVVSWPIIIANVATLILAGAILWKKLAAVFSCASGRSATRPP